MSVVNHGYIMVTSWLHHDYLSILVLQTSVCFSWSTPSCVRANKIRTAMGYNVANQLANLWQLYAVHISGEHQASEASTIRSWYNMHGNWSTSWVNSPTLCMTNLNTMAPTLHRLPWKPSISCITEISPCMLTGNIVTQGPCIFHPHWARKCM